jgi:Zn-dependent peptidase ImmA (M78 family)/DNA-binding XRE family transcriptional regulator
MTMDPRALRRARELRGLSANALATALEVSQAVIWKVEAGQLRASAALTAKVAEHLDVPTEFLLKTPRLLTEGSVGLFRAHSSKVSKTQRTSIRQVVSVISEFVDRLADDIPRPQSTVPRAFGDSPLLVASRTRALLGYSDEEPIGNLTRRLERIGVTVVKASLPSEGVFGYSTWTNEKVPRPLIALNHNQTPYKLRWTLAHELGHLVLGHEYESLLPDEAEEQADAFAGELLAPTSQLRQDLKAGTTLSALSYLKTKYGVSISGLSRLGHKIDAISAAQYRSIQVQISQRGWRKSEPGDESATYEEPALIRELTHHRFGAQVDLESVADSMHLPFDIVYPAMVSTREFKDAMRLQLALK